MLHIWVIWYKILLIRHEICNRDLNYYFPFYRPGYSHLLRLWWTVYAASLCTFGFLLEDSFLSMQFSLVRFDNLLRFSDQILQIFNCSVINLRHSNNWKNKMFLVFFSDLLYVYPHKLTENCFETIHCLQKSLMLPHKYSYVVYFIHPYWLSHMGGKKEEKKLFLVWCFKRNLEMKYLFILKKSTCLATPVEILLESWRTQSCSFISFGL